MLAGPEAGQLQCEALHVDGGGRHAVADVGAPVAAEGVRQMCLEGCNGALAGGLGLEDEACKIKQLRERSEIDQGNGMAVTLSCSHTQVVARALTHP